MPSWRTAKRSPMTEGRRLSSAARARAEARGETERAQQAFLRAFALDPSLADPLSELRRLGWPEIRLAELRATVSSGRKQFIPRWNQTAAWGGRASSDSGSGPAGGQERCGGRAGECAACGSLGSSRLGAARAHRGCFFTFSTRNFGKKCGKRLLEFRSRSTSLLLS